MSYEIFDRSIKDSQIVLDFNRRIRETKDVGYKEHLIEQRDNFKNLLEAEYEQKQLDKFFKEINGYDEFA